MKTKIYSIFDVPPAVNTGNDQPSMTEQSHHDDCDINFIMARYQRTGVLGNPLAVGGREPQFGDFTSVHDFHTAQNILAESTQLFEQLPAQLRKRFENDPGQMLEFLGDENNREEAIKLGLVANPESDNRASRVVPTEPVVKQAPTEPVPTEVK